MKQTNLVTLQRIAWLDVVRVLSALAIVFIHTSTSLLGSFSYGGFSWWSADFYLASARAAVPLFVMISGVFFLDPSKNVTVKNIYTKYVWRMLTVLLGWALVRTLVIGVGFGGVQPGGFAAAFFTSVKMFWFLPMIIGLYMVTPLLRPLTALKNQTTLLYCLGLSFALALCAPAAEAVELYLFPGAVPVADFTNLIKIPMWIFGAHFVFGYYANNYTLSRRAKGWLYALAGLSVALMMWGTYAFYAEPGSKLFFFSMHGASLSPLAFLLGAGVFVYAKDALGGKRFGPRLTVWLTRLARYSLGVYLLHIIVVEVLTHFGLFKYAAFCGAVSIPLAALGIFAFSNAVIATFYQIPFVRRYFL